MAERKPVVLVGGQLKELPAWDTLPPQAPASHSHATSDVTGLDAALSGKEPSISAGTTAQYRRGDKTWRDFFTDVRAATLTGLSTATNAVIDAADTVLVALGKLQAQITGHTGATSGAHEASAIHVAAVTPATSHSIPEGTVQGLLATNWQDVGGLMEWQGFHTSGAGTQHPASTISNIPAGGIAATNVQAAINELDSEKLPKTGGTVTGDLLVGSGVIGYGAGSGGTVTQPTSKSTQVTLNKPCGMITTHAGSLASGQYAHFSLNNSGIATTDMVMVCLSYSAGTGLNYRVSVSTGLTGQAVISLQNTAGIALADSVEIHFAVIKKANA